MFSRQVRDGRGLRNRVSGCNSSADLSGTSWTREPRVPWWWESLGWTERPWRTVTETTETRVERHTSGLTVFGRYRQPDDTICAETVTAPDDVLCICIMPSGHVEAPHLGPSVSAPSASEWYFERVEHRANA